MKTVSGIGLIVLLLGNSSVTAETLDEKVARNAANCLTGHIATNSEKYQSGESAQYLMLIQKIMGADKTVKEVKTAANNLKTSIQLMGGSLKNEAAWLIKTYCPAVDELLSK